MLTYQIKTKMLLFVLILHLYYSNYQITHINIHYFIYSSIFKTVSMANVKFCVKNTAVFVACKFLLKYLCFVFVVFLPYYDHWDGGD